MLAKAIFIVVLLIQIIKTVQGDLLLFEQGYIKFSKYGKRQVYYNVKHIDNKIISDDKYRVVIKAESLPILHPEAVRNLKNLQYLLMINCGIKKIETKAFFNLPNITTLHLQHNQIKEISYGIFNNLSLKILTLQKNQIKKIDSRAFDDMPNLFKIKLNDNKLKAWDSDWFKNCPKVTEIYFRKNRLNYLPPYAFSNLKGSHQVEGETVTDTKIFLSKNKLNKITPESFYNLTKLSQLFLDRNNLTEIPNEAFRDLTEIDLIYLARNKIKEIKENAFPKVKKIGILDVSSNLLNCLPYKLISVANLTNLQRNNETCECIDNHKLKLLEENKNNEITLDEEWCR